MSTGRQAGAAPRDGGRFGVAADAKGAGRRGLTLIELLVVIIILVTLVAAAVPLLAPANDDRRLREASRGANAFISGAQMRAVELQRPFGVALKKLGALTGSPEDNGTCLEIQYVEQPPPFTGFDETSAAMVAIDPTPDDGVQVAVRFVRRGQRDAGTPIGWTPDAIPPYTIRPGDVVEVSGNQYQIIDDSPAFINDDGFYEQDAGNPPGTLAVRAINDTGQMVNFRFDVNGNLLGTTNEAVGNSLWTYPAPYKILRQPSPVGEPFQLPEGTAIDLRASGEKLFIDNQGASPGVKGDFNGFFHSPDTTASPVVNNPEPVIVMFSPEGSIERVRFTQTIGATPVDTVYFDSPVVSNIYLLVGQPQNLPALPLGDDPTLDDGAMSGLTQQQIEELREPINWLRGDSRWIVIGAQSGRVVTVENAYVDPRAVAAGTSYLRRAQQIRAARELARDMTQLGGR